MKKGIIAGGLLLAVIAVVAWRYSSIKAVVAPAPAAKEVRITIDHTGTLGGFFSEVGKQAGIQYVVENGIAARPLQLALKDKTVWQMEKAVARAAGVTLQKDAHTPNTINVRAM